MQSMAFIAPLAQSTALSLTLQTANSEGRSGKGTDHDVLINVEIAAKRDSSYMGGRLIAVADSR